MICRPKLQVKSWWCWLTVMYLLTYKGSKFPHACSIDMKEGTGFTKCYRKGLSRWSSKYMSSFAGFFSRLFILGHYHMSSATWNKKGQNISVKPNYLEPSCISSSNSVLKYLDSTCNVLSECRGASTKRFQERVNRMFLLVQSREIFMIWEIRLLILQSP